MLVAVPLAVAASVPHFSYPKMVTANGFGAVVFADERLSDAYPHLYQEYSPGVVTPDVLYDTYFGVVDEAGAGGWLTDAEEYGYVPGTGILRVVRRWGDLEITEYDFAPMGLSHMGLAQVAEIRNVGTSASGAVQVVSLHNWHVGGNEAVESPSAVELRETGSDVSLTLLAPAATDVSCAGVYDAVMAGQRIGGGCNGNGNDMVPAFGFSVPSLQPGEASWVGVLTATDPEDWIGDRDPEDWVADEEAWWTARHAEGHAPPDLTDDEAAVYRQAIAFLTMGQVREEGAAYGQIPASLPLSAPVGDFQHIWNITWVRDASYAASALAAAGYAEDAADAVRFLIQEGKTGEYRAYVGDTDYAVSVCRTYGDGTEWSDADADGPNVEFDDFGLFLWALDNTREAGANVDDLLPRAQTGVADALVRLVDPSTGLLLPDSSIWERHWNGHQEQFTFSSAWAVVGLRAAAGWGDTSSDTYQSAADEIEAAIQSELLDAAGVVAASREQLARGDDYLDLAAVEVFNHGILDARGPEFDASLAAWDRELRVASGNGYHRNDDGSTYDEHEWIFVDFRIAEALRRSCRPDEAAAIEDWLTLQARANADTLPELLDPAGGDYAGPAPMLGFGAGAYVLAMQTRAEADAACTVEAHTECDCVADCGCNRGAKAVFLLPLLALPRRRRR